MPGEGRDLSWKQNARSDEDRGIGDEPSNSGKRSEVTDSVARQSEEIARLSLLCSVRQGVPKRRSEFCLQVLEGQWRRSRSRQPDVRGHRSVWRGAMVGRTDARTEKSNLSTSPCSPGVYPETRGEPAS